MVPAVMHGPFVAPMGSGLIFQHSMIISSDVYRRKDMHHDHMTLHHCIALNVLITSIVCDCGLD